MTDELALGVDIGGTKIAFVLIDTQGRPIAEHALPTQPADGVHAVLDRVAQGIQVLLDQAPRIVAGIGIGCPGYVDPAKGIVHSAVNLGWKEVALCQGVQQRLGRPLPVHLHRDANAAALGEFYFGAARGQRDFVLFVVGTGLGASALVAGELLLGAHGYGMELGHVPLRADGRLCACGQRGCPEMYISGNGFLGGVREYRAAFPDSPLSQLDSPTTSDILNAARAGDPLALQVIQDGVESLSMIIRSCVGQLDPGLFILGGGMGLAVADLLLPGIQREFQLRPLPLAEASPSVERSTITHSAIGAASLVWHNQQGY